MPESEKLSGVIFKKVGGFNSRCGTHARGRDQLTKMRVGNLTRSENTRDTSLHPRIDLQIAARIHIKLTLENPGIRGMTDKNKNAIGFKSGLFTSFYVLQQHSLHFFDAPDACQHRVQDKSDLWMFLR